MVNPGQVNSYLLTVNFSSGATHIPCCATDSIRSCLCVLHPWLRNMSTCYLSNTDLVKYDCGLQLLAEFCFSKDTALFYTITTGEWAVSRNLLCRMRQISCPIGAMASVELERIETKTHNFKSRRASSSTSGVTDGSKDT